MKDFIWFVVVSWKYMQSDKKQFFLGFTTAWKEYRRLRSGETET